MFLRLYNNKKKKIIFNFFKQWKLIFNRSVNRNGKKLTVSRKKVKILTISRKTLPHLEPPLNFFLFCKSRMLVPFIFKSKMLWVLKASCMPGPSSRFASEYKSILIFNFLLCLPDRFRHMSLQSVNFIPYTPGVNLFSNFCSPLYFGLLSSLCIKTQI